MKVSARITKVEMNRLLDYPMPTKRGEKIGLRANHTCLDPEKLDNDRLRSKHLLEFNIEDSDGNLIGTFECKVTVVISETDRIDEIYEAWMKNKYQNLPEDIQLRIDSKLTHTIFAPLSIVSEKMGLPPIVPIVQFAPKRESSNK